MDTGQTDELTQNVQAKKRKSVVCDFNYNWHCPRTLIGGVPYQI